ncbi:hypothetical protein C1I98_33520 [Spongiactinospora gelatinilytica]|uniref:Uncharacterized protein n=1 Tax=Spongiactinospora gelatinilytica TaxID=2666298 RepID=A0A2W2GJR7_9ACTN|nr:hypothetical protein [Spongiactinospora gelatinilytica]PZG27124.1 hypothetical protein C1I98_33520 [Spongiactinospora gelatinilytica]
MSRGSGALCGVLGLVLLSLLVATAFPGTAAGPASSSASASGAAKAWSWSPLDDGLIGLPPQPANVREHHVQSLWPPPPRGDRLGDAAYAMPLTVPGALDDTFRDPQQLTHRAAGSRSPPLG